ncbi:MAG: beta-galactosidase [Acidobacteriia bacterium]|nr:beta-galactosidase [Terriglobia bacterium]
MRNLIATLALVLACVFSTTAKTVVFWHAGFPTVASQPVARETLSKALDDPDTVFAGLDTIKDALTGADLLVLPYGSAFPAGAWSAIQVYTRAGGNLLVLGGQPFQTPVTSSNGKFTQAPPQDTYSRELGIQHTYVAPQQGAAKFAWRTGYEFLPAVAVRARRYFALEGRLNGLGYMVSAEGLQVAAPVVVMDRLASGGRGMGGPPPGAGPQGGAVLLDFDPAAGYWDSADGVSLIHASAAYARLGPVTFSLEMPFSAVKPEETPGVTVHLRSGKELAGEVKVELVSGNTVLETLHAPVSGNRVGAELVFGKPYPPGFYTVRGVWQVDGKGREAYCNGLWVEDRKMLTTGPVFAAKGDFLTRDGKPFFPVGANYFSTEANGWDFAASRNAWVWERDFAEMQKYGVNFIRTGVWGLNARQLDPNTKGVTERFLRNLEAFLLSARRHNIIVNWTFWAFTPNAIDPTAPPPQAPPPQAPAAPPAAAAAAAGGGRGGRGSPQAPPQPNVYLDEGAVSLELNYALSIVNRFKDIPWLSYDLINEPSFSNPGRLWTGNTPNGDKAELDLWHQWLAKKYGSLSELASAWRVTPESLGSFDTVPLPTIPQLTFDRYRTPGTIRASDYNLFAQEGFTRWVRTLVTAIRGAGSMQLVNVGQDEGGVTNRVLNQFYASGGVAFTTNHTYWQDDALLWDSVAAKRPGMPNITGETGYQPVRSTDSTWRYDELTGMALNEKKWVLGFAAGSSGALMWDWDREVDFGIKRSDGSAKTLQTAMRALGQFAEKAAPYATGIVPPQVALVLPQSFQLSVYNKSALEAQQTAVRALYYYARAEAYAVGEYQIENLGNPKLIILPSPKGLTESAWEAIRGKVNNGATLLVSGPFDGDPHFHSTGRATAAGLPYGTASLLTRHELLKFPGGEAWLAYGGEKTTYLDRAVLPDKSIWAEKTLGKGKILFSALPLELNDNIQAAGDVYKYALKTAGVAPTYVTTIQDPGMLICPTKFPKSTLYVLVSESGQQAVSFTDQRSGKQFSGTLDPGRSAILLVGETGNLRATYNWKGI